MKRINCLFVAVILLIGCGKSGPEKIEVTGTVSYRGQTLPLGSVMFIPKKGTPCVGEINAEGRYRLEAPAGEYGVQINAIKQPEGGRPDPSVEGGMVYPPGARATPLVPPRYNNVTTSRLIATVSSTDTNIDFHLR